MRRLAITATIVLSLAACTPLAAQPSTAHEYARNTRGTRVSSAQPRQAQPRAPIDWPAIIRRQHAEKLWWAEVVRQQQAHARYLRLLRYAAAIEAARRAAVYPHGMCGGDLPPCYVMWRESRGIITARNPTSTASGKWQALDSTWRRFGGYRSAWLAPEKVQDDFARRLWNHGHGCSHWSACG